MWYAPKVVAPEQRDLAAAAAAADADCCGMDRTARQFVRLPWVREHFAADGVPVPGRTPDGAACVPALSWKSDEN